MRSSAVPLSFERLEALRPQPSATGTTRKPYEPSDIKQAKRPASVRAPAVDVLANDVRQQAEEAGALDGARGLALLNGGHRRDPARHDLAALGHVAHQQLGI